jgi:hypothetical protein
VHGWLGEEPSMSREEQEIEDSCNDFSCMMMLLMRKAHYLISYKLGKRNTTVKLRGTCVRVSWWWFCCAKQQQKKKIRLSPFKGKKEVCGFARRLS